MGGDRQCVIEDGHTISYAQLDDLVERLLERVARIHGEREVSFVEERHAKPRILAPIADAEEVGTRDLSALRILASRRSRFRSNASIAFAPSFRTHAILICTGRPRRTCPVEEAMRWHGVEKVALVSNTDRPLSELASRSGERQ